MKVHYAARTHPGQQRSNNEDNYFVLPEQNLYVVADGMGGHSSGEVASLLAVEALAGFFIESGRRDFSDWPADVGPTLTYDEKRLATGIKLANTKVHATAGSAERYRGMDTTVVALALGREGALLGHVGDSRGYLVREGDIRQVTKDHSLLNETLKIRELSEDEIRNFAHKNVIVRALGLADTVDVELTPITIAPEDVVIMCSDGLSDMLEDAEILSIVQKDKHDLDRAAQTLVSRANENGGVDNITAVLVGVSP